MSKNLLESLANWLESRSKTPWALQSGQSKLMLEYAAELRKEIPMHEPAREPDINSLFGK